jgi:L-lactate dehydrogenase complex protein LldG
VSAERRAGILSRIRRANGGSPGHDAQRRSALTALGAAPSSDLPGPGPAQSFLLNVLKNQGSIDAATDKAAAVTAIARYLREGFRTQRLVAGADPRLAALPWRDARLLPRFGAAEDGDVAALSYARLAVAETGSVILYSGREDPANNKLLPEAHLVLVDQADLVTTLEQACERIEIDIERLGPPRGIHMISGPSSTADVELQLVKGAHGPRAWHVILVGAGAQQTLQYVLTAGTGV